MHGDSSKDVSDIILDFNLFIADLLKYRGKYEAMRNKIIDFGGESPKQIDNIITLLSEIIDTHYESVRILSRNGKRSIHPTSETAKYAVLRSTHSFNKIHVRANQ